MSSLITKGYSWAMFSPFILICKRKSIFSSYLKKRPAQKKSLYPLIQLKSRTLRKQELSVGYILSFCAKYGLPGKGWALWDCVGDVFVWEVWNEAEDWFCFPSESSIFSQSPCMQLKGLALKTVWMNHFSTSKTLHHRQIKGNTDSSPNTEVVVLRPSWVLIRRWSVLLSFTVSAAKWLSPQSC